MTQQTPQPAPNLNPAAATGVNLNVVPPRIGALTAEKTRGTENAQFRIPLSVKALVQRVIHDPRFDYSGALAQFYLEAVAARLVQLEPYFAGDREFSAELARIMELDKRLALEEPLEEFRTRLDAAEEKAKAAIAAKSLDYGFNVLRAAVNFVSGCEEPLRSATGEMLRGSKPMQALCRALVEDEMYGLNDEVDRLQKFMGGAL